MSDEPRIILEDEPGGGGRSGPWLLVLIAVVLMAGIAFILPGGEPSDDDAIVQLPVPTRSSTRSTLVPATTTTTEPLLVLQTWVRSFERPLLLVQFETPNLWVTAWRPGRLPITYTHPIGEVSWVDFDAEGRVMAAIATTTSGRNVLWVGTANLLEPVLLSDDSLSATFHSEAPSTLAVASTTDEGTSVMAYAYDLGDGLTERQAYDVAGVLRLAAWSEEGFFLSGPDSEIVTWLHDDGTTEEIGDQVVTPSGAPLVIAHGASNALHLATPTGNSMVALPEGTISVSPQGGFAVADSPFSIELIDLVRNVELPLADSVGRISDWSEDDRWFVYVSDIESYRLGELTRFVFVDTENGSSVSVALTDDQIERPHMLAIGR